MTPGHTHKRHLSSVITDLLDAIEWGGDQMYVVSALDGRVIAGLVSLEDMERLWKLDQHAQDRERAERRGEKWKDWEDSLMLDQDLDELDIAIQTQRTVKSVHERRRWIRKIAAARNGQ